MLSADILVCMSSPESVTIQQVADLVTSNQVIRAPYYQKDHDEAVQFTDPDKGLQWGADVIPALLGLFRVEHNSKDDNPDSWVGFARHWRGGTLRLGFDLFWAPGEADPVVVVTAISGWEGTDTIEDDVGSIDVPDQIPTQDAWEQRGKEYQTARRNDDSDGSASVQAFIAALPGWKRELATRFDELVQSEVPDVRRAVRWHQPFYGIEDTGWFTSVSAFSKHVKLTFVSESFLEPKPPNAAAPDRQALDVTETDELDNEQVASWIRQAADTPGMNW
jgi:hypothetical protein